MISRPRLKVPDLALRQLRRELRIGAGLVVLLVIVAFGVALYFVAPAPPKRLVMSTGIATGDDQRYGLAYRRILAQDGVDLELRPSQGALENIGRLMDSSSDVDVAFFQSGTGYAANAPHVVSLGTLYYEPLWVFYRGRLIDELHQLHGRRIAIGAPQSGTNALALQLLAINSAVLPPTQLLPYPGEEAAAMLEAGRIDALLHVAPAESPVVQRLIHAKGVHLLSFAQADAYTRRFPYLTRVTLPRGVFDLVGNRPDHDLVLLSPTANLLARDSLHPALAYLLMRAASEVHGEGSLLSARGEFPTLRDADFPYSEQAQRYYKSGPPLLQRYLPYWAAVLVDRLWVMVLPVLAIVVPLSRLLPQLYNWRMRARLYRWYGRLKEIELELEERCAAQELEGMLQRLDQIEQAVSHLALPLAFSENWYSFRANIELVRARVHRRLSEAS